ncbi:MAG: protein kinase [Deltaproteobacteria bacterium]|nr:protein kinase [Deltaproteobacteria bacterium]
MRTGATTAEVRARQASSARAFGVVFKTGEIIADRYNVRAILGSGGTGVVYRVLDEHSRTEVALKIVNAKLVQTVDERRLLSRQIKLSRKLKHPNVVRILDDGWHGERAFFTMELLEGLSLRKIIDLRVEKHQVFQPAEVRAIFMQLSDALDRTARTTFHGNLKPDNVIVLPDLLKVTDFPLLRGLPRKPFLAVQKSRGHNFRYLAPEVRLEVAELDSAVDIYSLGVILSEMLTGVPYDDGKPGALERTAAQLGPRVSDLIRHAVAREPRERHRSPRRFLDDLMSSLAEGPEGSASLLSFASPGDDGAPHVDERPAPPSAVDDPTRKVELAEYRALEVVHAAVVNESGREEAEEFGTQADESGRALSSVARSGALAGGEDGARRGELADHRAATQAHGDEAESQTPEGGRVEERALGVEEPALGVEEPGDGDRPKDEGAPTDIDRLTIHAQPTTRPREGSGSFSMIDDDMIEDAEPASSHGVIVETMDASMGASMGESAPPDIGSELYPLDVPIAVEEEDSDEPELAPRGPYPFSRPHPALAQSEHDAGLLVLSPTHGLVPLISPGLDHDFALDAELPGEESEEETIASLDGLDSDQTQAFFDADIVRQSALDELSEISNSSIHLLDAPHRGGHVGHVGHVGPVDHAPTHLGAPDVAAGMAALRETSAPSAPSASEGAAAMASLLPPAGDSSARRPLDPLAFERTPSDAAGRRGAGAGLNLPEFNPGIPASDVRKPRPATRPRLAAPITDTVARPMKKPGTVRPATMPSLVRAIPMVTARVTPAATPVLSMIPRRLRGSDGSMRRALWLTAAMSALALVVAVVVVFRVMAAHNAQLEALHSQIAAMRTAAHEAEIREQTAKAEAEARAADAARAARAEEAARETAEAQRLEKQRAEAAARQHDADAKRLARVAKTSVSDAKDEAERAAELARSHAVARRREAEAAAAKEQEARELAAREAARRKAEEGAQREAEARALREAEARQRAEDEAAKLSGRSFTEKPPTTTPRTPFRSSSAEPGEGAAAEGGAPPTASGRAREDGAQVASLVGGGAREGGAPDTSAAARCPTGMVFVDAGGFMMGSAPNDPERDFEDLALSAVDVRAFCIDAFEYPNGRGRRPTTGVTWETAGARCKGRGKRLCTEGEWEKACKGRSGARYPYGNQWDPDVCASEAPDGTDRPLGLSGTFKRCRSGYNVFDLSGNAAEWTATKVGSAVISKGGAADRPGYDTRCAARRKLKPTAAPESMGFRCCADLASPASP